MATSRTSFAALTFELADNGQAVRLLPAGTFRATDGRPFDAPGWRITAALAAILIERTAHRANAFVIDYEHQTLNAEWNGQPAPAAGWFRTLEWREAPAAEGGGLWAVDVEWTARAAAMIASREYRYLSPVFRYDHVSGDVLEVVHAALTNFPGLDGLTDLAQRAALKFSHDPSKEETVKREQLIALLGLPADADDASVTAALTALQTKAVQSDTLSAELVALRSNNPDPARFVPVDTMRELQGQVAALTRQMTEKQATEVVDAALREGRLLPAQEQWARSLASSNLDALRQYLEATQPLGALKGNQTQGKAPADPDAGAGLDETTLAVCRMLGNDPAQVAATLKGGQA